MFNSITLDKVKGKNKKKIILKKNIATTNKQMSTPTNVKIKVIIQN